MLHETNDKQEPQLTVFVEGVQLVPLELSHFPHSLLVQLAAPLKWLALQVQGRQTTAAYADQQCAIMW